MNEIERANNFKTTIKEAISLAGKEGCVESFEFEKKRFPKIYAYKCEILGCDLVEYVKDLMKAC